MGKNVLVCHQAIGLKNVFDKEKQEIQNSTLVENDICDNITTNLINGKQYIGRKTSNEFVPSYYGSGRHL